MVAKISIGSSLYGALAYNGEKINKEKGRLLATNKIFDAGTEKVDIHRAVEDFKCYMPLQLRTEKPVIHISLNPHPDDVLTNVELSDIAREYMDKLGYGNQPYMVYKHEDINRHHLHIVSIRVDETGKCLNNAYNYSRSKAITRELEKKYELHPAERKHTTGREPVKRVNISDGNVKQQVRNVTQFLMRYYFQTMGEYRALLSLYNVTVEDVQGQIRDREYNGLMYFATDDNGNKTGNPYKASLLGKSVGYRAFEKHIAKSKQHIKDKKMVERTKTMIITALKPTTNRKEFVEILKEKGIDIVLRETDNGRIYGVTFIDHNVGCVLNGSRLGKAFSANALQDRFTIASANPEEQTTFNSTVKSDDSKVKEQTTDKESMLFNDFSFDGMALFSLDEQTIDYEEEAFIRQMQRKRKKKRNGKQQ